MAKDKKAEGIERIKGKYASGAWREEGNVAYDTIEDDPLFRTGEWEGKETQVKGVMANIENVVEALVPIAGIMKSGQMEDDYLSFGLAVQNSASWAKLGREMAWKTLTKEEVAVEKEECELKRQMKKGLANMAKFEGERNAAKNEVEMEIRAWEKMGEEVRERETDVKECKRTIEKLEKERKEKEGEIAGLRAKKAKDKGNEELTKRIRDERVAIARLEQRLATGRSTLERAEAEHAKAKGSFGGMKASIKRAKKAYFEAWQTSRVGKMERNKVAQALETVKMRGEFYKALKARDWRIKGLGKVKAFMDEVCERSAKEIEEAKEALKAVTRALRAQERAEGKMGKLEEAMYESMAEDEKRFLGWLAKAEVTDMSYLDGLGDTYDGVGVENAGRVGGKGAEASDVGMESDSDVF